MGLRVLHLPKWFPNKYDLQNGIFIDKHIVSTADDYEHIVCSIYKDHELNTRVKLTENKQGNITYISIAFKPYSSKIFNVLQYGKLGLQYAFKYAKNVQIIHSHVMGRNVFIGWLISLIKPVKLIHTEHWTLFVKDKQWRNKSSLYKKTTKFLFGKMAYVLTVSDLLNTNLLKINSKINTKIIGNVISENTYKDIPKSNVFTFINVSDLRDDNKNISGIIRAFLALEKEIDHPIHLHIVGGGADAEKLEKLAAPSKQIFFKGRQTNTQVYQSMNAAHCLILNSRVETFGMVVPEAFSCGLPVICAKNGVTESFVDHECGLVVNQEDDRELKQAMKTMVINYKQYNADIICSKAKPYSKTEVGNKIKQIYKRVLNEA